MLHKHSAYVESRHIVKTLAMSEKRRRRLKTKDSVLECHAF